MLTAFPLPTDADNNERRGMDLRDYFAAKAMHAIINEPSMASGFGRDFVAREAYLMADAMLKAREQ